MNINIVANGEMVAKACHFAAAHEWRTYLKCIHIMPSILGGINIIACNGWELLIFYDAKGKCNKADGISIDFNKSRLKTEAKKIKNCKKKVFIRGPYSNPECRFNLKQYRISLVNHSTKNFRTSSIGSIAPEIILKESLSSNFYDQNLLKKIKYLNLHSQKTVSGSKPIAINKTKDGKLLLTSQYVCYMLMPLYLGDNITASSLHELWSGATGTEINLLLAAKSKKDLTKLLDSAVASSIYDVYNELQDIGISN